MKNQTNNKLIFIYAAVLIVIFIKAFSYSFNPKIDLNGDNLSYYFYAKAVLQGGYTDIMSVANKPTNNFPPGYPLLMAGIMLFTKNIIVIKIFNGILLLGGIFMLVYLLYKNDRALKELYFAMAAVALINPAILHFTTMMMSEMAYFFFIILTGFFLYKTSQSNPVKDPYFWLAVFSAAYAYHIRTAAVAIFGAVIFYYLFYKRWRHLFLFFAGYVVCLLPWIIRNKVLNVPSSRYFSQMMQVNAWDKNAGTLETSGMFERFGTNIRDIITKQIPDALFSIKVDYNASATFSEWIIGIILVALIIFGLFKIKKLNFYFIGVILATGAILMPWNGGGGTRYITSVIPILYLGLFLGVYQLFTLITKSPIILRLFPFAMALIVFAMVKPGLEEQHKIAKADFHPAYKNYFRIAEEVKKQTPPNTIICVRKPSLFYFFAERPVGKYIFSPDDKKMIEHMYKSNFSYVVLEQLGYGSTPKYLYPTIQKNPKVFKVIMHLKDPDTYLLQFNREEAKKLLQKND